MANGSLKQVSSVILGKWKVNLTLYFLVMTCRGLLTHKKTSIQLIMKAYQSCWLGEDRTFICSEFYRRAVYFL